jgi:membrane protein
MATLRDIVSEYWADRPTELAAALSYYTLLSLAPLVLVTVAVAGLVFERAAVEGKLVSEMRLLIGDEGAEVARTVLRHGSRPATDVGSVVIGIALLLVGATSVFVQLQDSLNRLWKVEAAPRRSAVWIFVKERLLSLAMVLGIGFVLLVSLVVSAAVSALAETVGPMGDLQVVLETANTVASLAVITALFAMIFKFLPDTPVAWGDVWLGATVTSVLFTAGKSVIGLYLGRAGIGSAYGAAGSLVVLTVWVYYASLIVFFGAKLTAIRSHRRRAGGPAAP